MADAVAQWAIVAGLAAAGIAAAAALTWWARR